MEAVCSGLADLAFRRADRVGELALVEAALTRAELDGGYRVGVWRMGWRSRL